MGSITFLRSGFPNDYKPQISVSTTTQSSTLCSSLSFAIFDLPILYIVDELQGKLNTEPLCALSKQLYKDHKCHHQIGEHECKPLHLSLHKTSVSLRITIQLKGNLGKRSQEFFLLRPVGGGQQGSELDKTVSKISSILKTQEENENLISVS